MIKESLKQLLRDGKEKIRYLKYKNTLPANPMHDDIYIVEFPKSGITWLQHILGNIELQLSGRKNEHLTYFNYSKYLPDIHLTGNESINRFLDRTYIKSHAQYNPYYNFVIYLIRNPFDVMVSYYNFELDLGYKGSFNDFVKSDIGMIGWKNHVNSWNNYKITGKSMHFVLYENLLKNTFIEIKTIYKNLGIDNIDEIIYEAIQKSNLHNMSKSENHYKKYNPNDTMDFVGKKGKISKEKLLTYEMKTYIFDEAKEEIKKFYPEIYKDFK